jgi:hypothetical protein
MSEAEGQSNFEEMKLRHEAYLAEMARRQAAATQYAIMVSASDTLARQNSFQYGKMTLQSIFLLNGGALISLLAFMGSVAKSTDNHLQPQDFVQGFSFYVVGLVLVVLSMLFAYFNYLHLALDHSDPGGLSNAIIKLEEEWPNRATEENSSRISGSYYGAIVLGVLSLISFLIGSVSIAIAL